MKIYVRKLILDVTGVHLSHRYLYNVPEDTLSKDVVYRLDKPGYHVDNRGEVPVVFDGLADDDTLLSVGEPDWRVLYSTGKTLDEFTHVESVAE